MKIYLYTKSSVLIQVNGEMFELATGRTMEVEHGSFVSVFPECKNCIPFCFRVDKEKIFQCQGLKVTEYPDFLVLEIAPKTLFTGEYLVGKNFKDHTVCLMGKPYKFLIDTDSEHYSFDVESTVEEINIFEDQHVICLQGMANDEDYVVLFHKNAKKFYEFSGEFEMADRVITLIKDKKSLARHGEVCKFEITDEKILNLSTEIIYLNGKPAKVAPFLNHIAFFQSVREQDFNLAKTYLTHDFAERVNPQHFKSFFGGFNEIRPLTEDGEHKVALISKISPSRFVARTFVLKTTEGNMIKDIVEG